VVRGGEAGTSQTNPHSSAQKGWGK